MKITRSELLAMFCGVMILLTANSVLADETLKTRIGDLTFENSFEHGIPTAKTAKHLFETIDFQRASQAYIWAIPVVSMYQWI